MNKYKYIAFISYSRKDKVIAKELHDTIEKYRYPQNLVPTENMPFHNKYVRPIFRDISNLSVLNESFVQDIFNAIESSKYLIVICSQNSAQSQFVNTEIDDFIKTHENPLKHIIPIIVDWEVNINNAPDMVIPGTLMKHWDYFKKRNIIKINQDYGDVKIMTKERAFFQVIGYMLDVEWYLLFDKFKFYSKQKNRTLIIRIVVFFTVVTVLLSIVILKQKDKIKADKALIEFEKGVFPYSIVCGYVDNFLAPVLEFMNQKNEKCKIIIFIPENYKEIDLESRKSKYVKLLTKYSYNIETLMLKTRMTRESTIAAIKNPPDWLESKNIKLYIDFASTLKAFKEVIDYKKKNDAYNTISEDELTTEYARSFTNEVNKQLTNRFGNNVLIFISSEKELIKFLNNQI